MWFEDLTGFQEESPDQVRNLLEIDGHFLSSKINGGRYRFGNLEIPSLNTLRLCIPDLSVYDAKVEFSEEIGNVQLFHQDPNHYGAVFQAASQFNLLEMTGPSVSPESGVGIYEHDLTQGPACAIACGAGTIFRNYFVEVNGLLGQSTTNQIDCLSDIGDAFGNENSKLWDMSNGYAMVNFDGLKEISKQIRQLSKTGYEELKGKLKVGCQIDAEVTTVNYDMQVSQVYCAALPIAYTDIPSSEWELFARLILEATYEATLYAALLNYERTAVSKVFLTMVGGGVFGNELPWILESLAQAVTKFSNTPLDIRVISYGKSSPGLVNLVESLQ